MGFHRFNRRGPEESRKDDQDLQSSSHHVFALDGEMMNVNGKLLAGHNFIDDDFDQTSVCSCNCLGLNHADNERYVASAANPMNLIGASFSGFCSTRATIPRTICSMWL